MIPCSALPPTNFDNNNKHHASNHGMHSNNNNNNISPEAPAFRASAMTMTMRCGDSLLFENNTNLRCCGFEEPKTLATTGWKNPSLTLLEYYHPVAPSNLQLPLEQCMTVLDRLMKAFPRLSMQVIEYRDEPIQATVTTMDRCCCVVSLYDNGEDSLLVEVQRKSGDSIAFQRNAKSILKAAAGDIEEKNDMICCNSQFPHAVDNLALQFAPVQVEDDPVFEALEILQDLISSDRVDARMLGLESATLLVDPMKTGAATAKRVCCAIWNGQLLTDNAEEDTREIQDRFICLLMNGMWTDLAQYAEETHGQQVLVCLAHAISQMSQPEIRMLLQRCYHSTGRTLMDRLQELLYAAGQNPHTAYLAAHCLSIICQTVPETKTQLRVAVVEQAQLVGSCHHAALATASNRLLGTLA